RQGLRDPAWANQPHRMLPAGHLRGQTRLDKCNLAGRLVLLLVFARLSMRYQSRGLVPLHFLDASLDPWHIEPDRINSLQMPAAHLNGRACAPFESDRIERENIRRPHPCVLGCRCSCVSETAT